jgi:hypothetical protein
MQESGGIAKNRSGAAQTSHGRGWQAAGRVGGAGPLAQVDQLIGGLLEPEPLGQGGGQQEAGVGD